MIQKIGAPMAASNGAYGSFSLNSTVLSFGALTLSTMPNVVFWGDTFMNRSNDQATSAAVTGRPFIGAMLCHFASGRRLNVQVVPSALGFQVSARSPSMMYAWAGMPGPFLEYSKRL